ncbi:uncharacterized protein [Epargyreus clarus]|uniref:uncharacterized protein n=1 Tax=Epargyreus clarus TaxID=520877 RepID=UPI003C2C430B
MQHHAILNKTAEPARRVETSECTDQGAPAAVMSVTSKVAPRAVLLKTCEVKLNGPRGEIRTHALLDEGSTVTLIDEELASQLTSGGPNQPLNIRGINEQRRIDSKAVKIQIKGLHEQEAYFVTARTVKGLQLHHQRVPQNLERYAHLRVCLEKISTGEAPPRILIGTDNWHLIVSRQLRAALLKVTEDIRWAVEDRQLTLLVLLDFSNAFSSVDFDILLGILQSINISSITISWFDSYLRGRSQRVRVDNSFSDSYELHAGVPQGGVLSPLLFSLFINSITSVISCKYHLYADDLQLYHHFNAAESDLAITTMNDNIRRVVEWSKSFGLRVNPLKTQAIIIGSRHARSLIDYSTLASVNVDGSLIPYSETVKDLGLLINSTLSWNAHVNEVSRRVHYSLHSIKCLQGVLPLKTKITLAQTLIQPIIDYADACYLDATEELLNKLERLQNLCIRFIFGIRKYDHVSHLRKDLKWLPIRLRRNTRILCLLFNILNSTTSPTYLRERFSYARPSIAPCRTHRKTLLRFPPHKTSSYSKSFTVHAVRLWNSLPPNIRESKNISIFKKRVKDHYFSLAR